MTCVPFHAHVALLSCQYFLGGGERVPRSSSQDLAVEDRPPLYFDCSVFISETWGSPLKRPVKLGTPRIITVGNQT